jgi:hypothetical protein
MGIEWVIIESSVPNVLGCFMAIETGPWEVQWVNAIERGVSSSRNHKLEIRQIQQDTELIRLLVLPYARSHGDSNVSR